MRRTNVFGAKSRRTFSARMEAAQIARQEKVSGTTKAVAMTLYTAAKRAGARLPGSSAQQKVGPIHEERHQRESLLGIPAPPRLRIRIRQRFGPGGADQTIPVRRPSTPKKPLLRQLLGSPVRFRPWTHQVSPTPEDRNTHQPIHHKPHRHMKKEVAVCPAQASDRRQRP